MPPKDKETRLAYYRAYRNKDENKQRIRHRRRSNALRTQYGLSETDYSTILTAQGGLCAACRQSEEWSMSNQHGGTKRKRLLAVDHDHATGRVRGLLCGSCNCALGLLKEDPLRIQALQRYIESSACLN